MHVVAINFLSVSRLSADDVKPNSRCFTLLHSPQAASADVSNVTNTDCIGLMHNEVTGRNLAISRLMLIAGVDIQHPIRPPTLSRTYIPLLKLTHEQLQPTFDPSARAGCNNYSDSISHDQHLANYVVV